LFRVSRRVMRLLTQFMPKGMAIPSWKRQIKQLCNQLSNFVVLSKMKLSKSSLFWSNVNMSMIAISGQNKKLHKDNVKIHDKHRALAIKNYC
jgi:hypothetical protein